MRWDDVWRIEMVKGLCSPKTGEPVTAMANQGWRMVISVDPLGDLRAAAPCTRFFDA